MVSHGELQKRKKKFLIGFTFIYFLEFLFTILLHFYHWNSYTVNSEKNGQCSNIHRDLL